MSNSKSNLSPKWSLFTNPVTYCNLHCIHSDIYLYIHNVDAVMIYHMAPNFRGLAFQSFCRNNFRGWTAKWPFAVLVYNIYNYIYTRVCKEKVCPNASCSDCCIVLCCSWPVVVVVVECCYCIPYRLVLMLVLTFAPSVLTFAPCALTFAPCACGVILLSTSACTPLARMLVVTSCNWHWWRFPSAIGTNSPGTGGSVTHCNLCWWSFSLHPLAHLRSSILHCVVVARSGGTCIYIYIGPVVCPFISPVMQTIVSALMDIACNRIIESNYCSVTLCR